LWPGAEWVGTAGIEPATAGSDIKHPEINGFSDFRAVRVVEAIVVTLATKLATKWGLSRQ